MKINKKNPFKVPPNYFNDMEVSLFKSTLDKPLSPFEVPEDYFDTLEKEVFQKTMKDKKGMKKISFYAFAALFIFFILSVYWIQYTSTLNTLEEEIEWVIFEEMNSYDLATTMDSNFSSTAFENLEEVDLDYLDYILDFNETIAYENLTD